MKLTRADREALQRSIDMMRAESDSARARIDEMLIEDGWERAGRFASYHCQDSRLHLKPWMTPPCWLRTNADMKTALATPPPDLSRERAAAELVQRLLARNLSRYEPNPLR